MTAAYLAVALLIGFALVCAFLGLRWLADWLDARKAVDSEYSGEGSW